MRTPEASPNFTGIQKFFHHRSVHFSGHIQFLWYVDGKITLCLPVFNCQQEEEGPSWFASTCCSNSNGFHRAIKRYSGGPTVIKPWAQPGCNGSVSEAHTVVQDLRRAALGAAWSIGAVLQGNYRRIWWSFRRSSLQHSLDFKVWKYRAWSATSQRYHCLCRSFLSFNGYAGSLKHVSFCMVVQNLMPAVGKENRWSSGP